MIKTIVFNGGLGNQMFQYAFYLQMKKKQPLSIFLFDIDYSQSHHYGYELDKIFHINSIKQVKNHQIIKQYCPFYNKIFHTIQQENSLEYKPQILSTHYPFIKYEGFWQSEYYFKNIEKDVRKAFLFNTDLLSTKNKEISTILTNNNSVAIHIRRGDYLQQPDIFGVCTTEYYAKAISYIQSRINNTQLVFFSDDIEWVNKNLHYNNALYVNWNTGNNSWQDMYLMSICKHNIIANSSFSWWGAWLNNNENKIVIAPQKWFLFSPNHDIIPNKWITIE